MISWLVVDLGGVAASYRPENRLAALAEVTGLLPNEIHDRLFSSGLDEAAESGFFTKESITQELLRCLDNRLDKLQVIDCWSQAFEPNLELLELLSAQTVPRCLFTNNGPMIDLCLEGPLSVLHDKFDRVLCSWHTKARKPDTAAFDYVANTLRVPPSELLLIDDDIRNITAATQAGWAAHHYTTLEKLRLAIGSRLAP